MRLDKQLIDQAQEVFQSHMEKPVSAEEAEGMLSHLGGFYAFLHKWDRAFQKQDSERSTVDD